MLGDDYDIEEEPLRSQLAIARDRVIKVELDWGKTSKEAIRALKRRISDAVYRQLQTDAPNTIN